MSSGRRLSEDSVPIELPPLPSEPLVSVLIANYNYGQYIGEAIQSVLNQSYQKLEIVICDDGSTDNSVDVIETYAKSDRRLRYIAKANGGMASALNVAFQNSIGDILTILDADDVFVKHKLETVVEAFKTSNNVGLITHRMLIIVDGRSIGVIPIFTRVESGYIGNRIYSRGGRWRYMPASSLCFRREIANLLFPIDETLFRSEADAFLFTVAPIITEVAFVDNVLAYYRLHGRNLTGWGELTPRGIIRTIATLERVNLGVNRRLAGLGLPGLDLHRNLNYWEQKTMWALMDRDTEFVQRVRALMRLTRGLLFDDLYTPVQKFGGIFAYWSALFVPLELRGRYLMNFTHPSRVKELVRQVGNVFRRKRSRGSRDSAGRGL